MLRAIIESAVTYYALVAALAAAGWYLVGRSNADYAEPDAPPDLSRGANTTEPQSYC